MHVKVSGFMVLPFYLYLLHHFKIFEMIHHMTIFILSHYVKLKYVTWKRNICVICQNNVSLV